MRNYSHLQYENSHVSSEAKRGYNDHQKEYATTNLLREGCSNRKGKIQICYSWIFMHRIQTRDSHGGQTIVADDFPLVCLYGCQYSSKACTIYDLVCKH